MLSSTVVLLTTIALALRFVAARPSLSLKVTGPVTVDTVEDLRFMAILTNSGDETLKVLRDPRGVLSELPANKFSIVGARGSRPSFTGIKVKYVPEVAAKAGAYATLAPGQSIEVSHDLAKAYNFATSGAGTYKFVADNSFYIVEENSILILHADAYTVHQARVSGNFTVHRTTDKYNTAKRPHFVNCTALQQSAIDSVIGAAEAYATSAYSYINATTTGTPRYTIWFGTYVDTRRSTVLSHFAAIGSSTFSTFTYDCSCNDVGTYAYVYPTDFGHIYLCGAFWNAPLTGKDSRAGTIIHESSHFTKNGGSQDYVYGQTAAKSLAVSNPSHAVMNADSHEYFTENTPSLP
ncbi:deuterolysin M35 metalloprotease [Macrolepiota fuliginosa MF-IS2]|uniref:Deuterolysin M35 metalloprotease n=1 Tax=Macrolepiota fuliginosa MF-IS2 TaxID=1400762 RepID=A0A9P6C222_9AGAR|nr:deuterolysin M35 metalloprotease [Macrolepiota fuliginosa MF-IS2]KAF9449092.1 deuterolysin M35 metalloprotease [Macrolepiota fuliginosa MF-IS2]